MSRKRAPSRSTSAPRRIVGDEMARELARDVGGGGRMAREIREHGAALRDVGLVVDLADYALRARLVQARIEHELVAVRRIAGGRNDGPAGQHLGEAGHVGLVIDRAHAERMQLEDLTREVLVEPGAADQAGDRLRADRAGVVEIEQHRRMALDRLQHVGEAAEHLRADGLALEPARHALGHVGGDAEVVRPEPHQPFDETELGRHRGIEPRLDLLAEELDRQVGFGRPRRRRRIGARGVVRLRLHRHAGIGAGGGGGGALLGLLAHRDLARLALLAEVERGGRGLARAQKVGVGDEAHARPLELGAQRPARVARDRVDRAGTRAEPETMQGLRGHGFRMRGHVVMYLVTRATSVAARTLAVA